MCNDSDFDKACGVLYHIPISSAGAFFGSPAIFCGDSGCDVFFHKQSAHLGQAGDRG